LFLKKRLRKIPSVVCSNWGADRLSKEQLNYAAVNAWASKLVGIELLEEYRNLFELGSLEEAIVHSRATLGDYFDEMKNSHLWKARDIDADFDKYMADASNPSPVVILFGLLMQEYFRNSSIPSEVKVNDLVPVFSTEKRSEGWTSKLQFKRDQISHEIYNCTPFPRIEQSKQFVHFKAIHQILRDFKQPKEAFDSIKSVLNAISPEEDESLEISSDGASILLKSKSSNHIFIFYISISIHSHGKNLLENRPNLRINKLYGRVLIETNCAAQVSVAL
jgi:hypothetical protein